MSTSLAYIRIACFRDTMAAPEKRFEAELR
jgi:hypothetical protein